MFTRGFGCIYLVVKEFALQCFLLVVRVFWDLMSDDVKVGKVLRDIAYLALNFDGPVCSLRFLIRKNHETC